MAETSITGAVGSVASMEAFQNSKVAKQNEPVESKDIPVEKEKEKEKALEPEQLVRTVEELNTYVNEMQRNLQFHVDEDLGRKVISVMDGETKELIRQIPSEEALELLKNMDKVIGVLFSKEV